MNRVPPCSGSFEPSVANEFVGTFNGTATNMVAFPFRFSIVHPVFVAGQVGNEIGDFSGSLGGLGNHGLESGDDTGDPVVEEVGKGGLHPLLSLPGAFSILCVGGGMEVLRAVVAIENLLCAGKYLFGPIPYPLCPVPYDAKAYLVFRDESGIFNGLQISGKFLVCRHLMPTDEVLDSLPVDQVESEPNILSVGLRLIALSQLDEKEHRKFLILDEQNCRLKPDLVSRLMAIVYTIARRLGFHILVISHHDLHHFREYADCIYRVRPPGREGEEAAVEKVEGKE